MSFSLWVVLKTHYKKKEEISNSHHNQVVEVMTASRKEKYYTVE